MASREPITGPYFFIFDFYMMKDSNDSNDIVPLATLYFYPTDNNIREQTELECGAIVGVVQYFRNDLFRSIIRKFHYQKSFILHEHYGRHSAFLCVPDDRFTAEEGEVYLKHILNLFNMLYGTWNHVQLTYEKDDKLKPFLAQALTPIINYVLTQHRSLTNLFSIIEYTPLKSGHQRVLLDSKHYLGHLKSKYGLHDGFIGYDNKVLYSTFDNDTTFYLQLLYQLKNEISDYIATVPWESRFQLRTGVSLFQIYIRRPIIATPTTRRSSVTNAVTITVPNLRSTARSIRSFDGSQSASEDSPSLSSSSQNPSYKSRGLSTITNERRLRLIGLPDQHTSSEDAGFDTDTMDDVSPRTSQNDVMSSSSFSDNPNDFHTEDSNSSSSHSGDEKRLTNEPDIRPQHSRTSTIEGDHEIEKTIEIERQYSREDLIEQIKLEEIPSFDTTDEEDNTFPVTNPAIFDYPRHRSDTMTSNSDFNKKKLSESDRHELQISYKDIPAINTEHERDQLVLYVQKNSRMTFVGLIEENLLTDDYLNKLWSLMVAQMANMDTEIQVIQTATDITRSNTDEKFEFNENTRQAHFKRIFDGVRYFHRIPTEESVYMAFFARTELNRNPERKVIGLSRGSHVVTIDRRLSDRISYTCQQF